jgi:hypothetical protein
MKESATSMSTDGVVDKLASEIDASGTNGQNVPLEAVRRFDPDRHPVTDLLRA